MRKVAVGAVLTAFIGFTGAPSARSCSSFITKKVSDAEGVAVCKSFDYDSRDGLVIVNKKGLRKTAVGQHDFPRKWKSKYYSVTFNHYGRELPNSGMNSEGLVVEALILGDTQYQDEPWEPKEYNDGEKGNISNLQFTQYILDTSADLDDAIANTKKVRIMGKMRFKPWDKIESITATPVHYAIYRGGEFIIVEYRDGHRWISPKLSWNGGNVRFGPHDEGMPLVPVLTNSRYQQSVASLKKFEGFCEGSACENRPLGWNTARVTPSLERFRYAAFAAKRGPQPATQSAKDYGFEALTTVRDVNTVWRIVHVPKKHTVYWATVDKEGNRGTIHKKKLDDIDERNRVLYAVDNVHTAKVKAMFAHDKLGMKDDGWHEYIQGYDTTFNAGGVKLSFVNQWGKYNYELLRRTLPHLRPDLSDNDKKAFAWFLTEEVNKNIYP